MNVESREETLVASALSGNRQSLRQILELYGPPIHGFLVGFFGRSSDWVRALMEEAFKEVLLELVPYEQKISFLQLVFTQLIPKLTQLKAPENETCFPLQEEESSLETILSMLEKVSPRQRILLLLRDQIDFSYHEMALILNAQEEALRHELIHAREVFYAETHWTSDKKSDPSHGL